MVMPSSRSTDDELRAERIEGLERIRRANADLVDRAINEGVTFQQDDFGALHITIGVLPLACYTQRLGRVRINVDRANDKISELVIDRVV